MGQEGRRATGWQLGGYTGDEGLGQAEQELWKGQRSWKTNRQDLATDSQEARGEEEGRRDANLEPRPPGRTDADALGGIFALGEGSLSDGEIHSVTRIMSLKIKVLN